MIWRGPSTGAAPAAASEVAAAGAAGCSADQLVGLAGYGTAGEAFCTSIWNSAGYQVPAVMSKPGMEPVE